MVRSLEYVVDMRFGGFPVYQPQAFYDECVARRWPTDWATRANSFTCPVGAEPGRGWLLILEKDALSALAQNQRDG